MGEGFKDELNKLLSDMLATFLIFLLSVFISGIAYAYYFIQAGSALMLWLPIVLLLVLLFYCALE
jgi:uncharacterized membrane protein YdfJ with MMPL/SSD domain